MRERFSLGNCWTIVLQMMFLINNLNYLNVIKWYKNSSVKSIVLINNYSVNPTRNSVKKGDLSHRDLKVWHLCFYLLLFDLLLFSLLHIYFYFIFVCFIFIFLENQNTDLSNLDFYPPNHRWVQSEKSPCIIVVELCCLNLFIHGIPEFMHFWGS